MLTARMRCSGQEDAKKLLEELKEAQSRSSSSCCSSMLPYQMAMMDGYGGMCGGGGGMGGGMSGGGMRGGGGGRASGPDMSGYKLDRNNRLHRPNGQFASRGEMSAFQASRGFY